MKRITRLVLLTSILFSAIFLQPPQVVQAANFPAQMNKSFTPISIAAGGVSIMSVTIYNPNSFELTSAHYHDFFPAGIFVSSPVTVTNNCGGTITNAGNGPIAVGDTSFQLNGGTVPPQSGGLPGQCAVTVAVTSTTPGNLINTIPANELTSTGIDNGVPVPITNEDPASATLQVASVLPPSLSKSFSLTTTWVGQATRLTINITNNDPITSLTETTLTDTFPVPFVLANPVNPSLTNCGPGTLTGPGGAALAPGQTSVTLNNGTIAPGAICSIAVNVVSNTQGANYTNTIPAGPAGAGSIRTRQGVTNTAAASAVVNVQAVGITKAFAATTIQETDYSVLTITLRNPTGTRYTGVGLVDTLPSGLSYVTTSPPTLSVGCNNPSPPAGTATVTASALTISNVSIVGGSVAAPGTCVITARVTGVASATPYTNTIPAGAMTGPVTNVLPATAQLTVQARSIGVVKSFSPSTINNNGTSTMTITLQNRTRTAYTGVGLIDNLPAGLVFTGAAPTLSASCNPPTATATLSGGPPPTRLTLANATIPGSTSANPVSNPGTCTITAQVTAISLGTWTNTLPIGSVCSTQGVCNGSAGSGSITVVNPLPVRLTKSFTNATIPAGGNSRLRLSIIAPADTALTNFSITDNLPTGVSVSNSSPPVFSAGCGAAGNRTLTALTGATSINLVLNTFAANATCNLDVWVTSSTPGTVTNTVTPANITNTQGRTIAANATANLSVTTLSMSKAFFPPTVNPNGLSTLTITLVNTNSSPLVSVGLLDSLPGSAANGIRIATPPNASTDCGGTLTTVANNQNITLANGTIPAQVGAVPGRCTIVVNVIGRGATATYTNTIPTTNVIGTIQGTATTIRPVANATAQIRVAPIGIQVVKGFNPLTVFGGASSVLSVQLINPNNSALSGIQFTDTMPVGMIIANPPNFNTGTCGGTLTGTVGSNVFTFSGGVLPASSTCTLTLRATMTVNGNLTNTIGAGAVTTFNGATNAQPAAATLTNLPGASVSKAFAPNPIYTGEYSLLTITIQNTGNIALSGMGLIDNLPAGTSIAGIPAPPPVNNCGGSLTAAAGTQLIQLTGGSLLGSQSCTLVIPVTSNVANDYLNTIPAGRLTSTEGATNQDPTSDTLRVLARASLGDFVWNDTNANGIQDAGEPGIENVTVELFNGSGVSQGTTTTNASGIYAFTNLTPGDYYLTFTPPAGFVFSPQNAGGDDSVDSDANTTTGTTATTTLTAGENDISWDAGLYQRASLGDFVWNDTNANGIQDAGEPGIENVTVELFNGSGVSQGTTTTNASGIYAFTNLTPGDYYLTFTPPAGFVFSPQNAGGDDSVDSDANTTTGTTATTTLTAGENDISWDAGLYQPEINVTKELSAVTFTNPDVARMTYTITIGPNAIPLTFIQAEDDLEAAFSPQPFSIFSLTATNLTVNPAYDGLTSSDTNLLTGSDTLDAGETGVITLVVDLTLNQNDPTATYINEVVASGLPPTGPRVTDRSSATGPLFADPAVTKSGDPTRVYVGELVTFTLTVTNNGNQTATDVVVVDPLPSNMSVFSAVATSGTLTIIPPRTVQVDIGDMDPNDVVTITIVARVNSTGSPPIINQVELTTTSPTDFDPNNRSSVTLEVLQPSLPETGFAPGKLTRVPAQPPSIVYSTSEDLSLSIPSLKINLPIVGVPKSGDGWDVTWLGNRAGWLNGTSFPTWDGNSVITGHVYLSNGEPGPFLNIGKLRYGDRLVVHAFGKEYTYEVRSVRTIKSYETATALKHQDRPWITLLTCKGFNEDTGGYDLRTIARAVLIQVK